MNIPPEFRRFTLCFHQDLEKEFGTDPERLIAGALALFGAPNGVPRSPTVAHEVATLKRFITELLSTKSDEEIRRIWHAGGGSIYFLYEGKIGRFIEMVRAALQ